MSITLPENMPAIRKLQNAPGLDWCEAVDVPEVGPRDVLVKVTHAGICGTDRHIYEWDKWSQDRVKIGITTGHEFVGEVIDTGSAVDRVSIGQRVSGEGHIGCGVCEMCRTGKGHICDKVVILGIDCNGCFAPYVSIPEENCQRPAMFFKKRVVPDRPSSLVKGTLRDSSEANDSDNSAPINDQVPLEM